MLILDKSHRVTEFTEFTIGKWRSLCSLRIIGLCFALGEKLELLVVTYIDSFAID